jgi:hypothetical protein
MHAVDLDVIERRPKEATGFADVDRVVALRTLAGEWGRRGLVGIRAGSDDGTFLGEFVANEGTSGLKRMSPRMAPKDMMRCSVKDCVEEGKCET